MQNSVFLLSTTPPYFDHEMSGSYADMEHLSIYAKLPIVGTNDKIILWTTTPWTLTSNCALAVNPEIEYVRVKVKSDDANLIVGKNALGKIIRSTRNEKNTFLALDCIVLYSVEC